MAKTQAAGEGVAATEIGAAWKRQIAALAGPVKTLAKSFGVVRESVKNDVGPRVMKLFNAIKAEHAAFTFVEFARLMDPTIPTHATDRGAVVGYRNHKVYYTLMYISRQTTQRKRGAAAGGGVRDSAVDSLARTIKTILQVAGQQGEVVWQAIQSEFGYGERIMGRLRKRVAATEPLFVINAKPGNVKVGNVIHMQAAEAANVEEMRQGGQRIRRSA